MQILPIPKPVQIQSSCDFPYPPQHCTLNWCLGTQFIFELFIALTNLISREPTTPTTNLIKNCSSTVNPIRVTASVVFRAYQILSAKNH